MKTMENMTVRIFGKNYEMDTRVVKSINDIIEKYSEKNPIVKKADSIFGNIDSGYYNVGKYKHISTIERGENVFSKMVNEVEEVVNNNSTPRDYQENLTVAKKYMKFVIMKQNAISQNDGTWFNELMEKENVPSDVIKKIDSVVHDNGCDNEIETYYFVEDLIEIYKMGNN